ncbi:MBL fold metallo-hydrolase [Microlunatus speluncae]|uniref:MBL fold metallo-hydrolase n=1 Tax=Microlunatus speluncae TaxID=2594267 RepID=UPI00126651A5|nr:MBL fold metallo-hydrolase [Microlunatus speluncae]
MSDSTADGTAAMGPGTIGAWRELADRVWVAVAEPEAVNLGLIAGDDGCLLIDCGSNREHGDLIRRSIGTVTAAPLIGVVVTHAHYDHANGLGAFADITTIGHESVRGELPADVPAPTRELAVAGGLDLGGRRVEIAHLGRGHTEGDLLIVVPDAQVVFAGDLIESAMPDGAEPTDSTRAAPWWGSDSVPHEWPATLDGLVGLMTDTSQAVPGHGEPVGREFVFDQRGRVAAVAGELQRLALDGVPQAEALERGEWPYPKEHIAGGIAPGYAQLAAERPEVGRRQLPLA